VEQGLESRRKERSYKPFIGLRLGEECKGRWKEIGEFLWNLKRPAGNTVKELQQFWW